jgi:glycosyltransferase involved in cell wall biosynthesis
MSGRLALSMIVRNGEQDLAHCLESVRGIVDEIVMADTGSTDSSIEVAQQFGARVIHVPWTNDFSAARNAALNAVSADWVLVLDADEQLDEQAKTQIAGATRSTTTAGYSVTIRNYVHNLTERSWGKSAIANDGRLPRAAHFPGYVEHENVRLFRKRPEIYFVGRVHETVGTRIREIGGKVKPADFLIHHFGFVAPAELKREKNVFYRELGRQKVQEMPESGQAHFELGLVELEHFHNNEEAARLFAKACDLSKTLAVAWFFHGVALYRLQRDAEALECFAGARLLGTNTTALAEAEGDAFYNCKQFAEARKAYRRALQLQDSTDVLSKLGLAEVRMKQIAPGLKKLTLAIAASAATPELHDRLVSAQLSLGNLAEAAQAAEDKLRATKPTESAYLRAAVLCMHAKQVDRALKIVGQGAIEFPESAAMKQAAGQLGCQALEEPHAANVATS